MLAPYVLPVADVTKAMASAIGLLPDPDAQLGALVLAALLVHALRGGLHLPSRAVLLVGKQIVLVVPVANVPHHVVDDGKDHGVLLHKRRQLAPVAQHVHGLGLVVAARQLPGDVFGALVLEEAVDVALLDRQREPAGGLDGRHVDVVRNVKVGDGGDTLPQTGQPVDLVDAVGELIWNCEGVGEGRAAEGGHGHENIGKTRHVGWLWELRL